MLLKSSFFAICILFVFSCSSSTETKEKVEELEEEVTEIANEMTDKPKRGLVGGWSEAEITPIVEEAATFAVSKLEIESPLKEILSVKSQVVKGMNYEITYSLEDGTEWVSKVYRDLDGTLSLTETIQK